MKDQPSFSIVMPALNEARRIAAALTSIREQNYPQEKVEVIVVDAGSSDETRAIAGKFGSRVIDNPHVQQEYGKHLGLLESRGKYVIFLDADEALENKNALAKRAAILEEHPEIKIVLWGGLQEAGRKFGDQ